MEAAGPGGAAAAPPRVGRRRLTSGGEGGQAAENQINLFYFVGSINQAKKMKEVIPSHAHTCKKEEI